MNENPLLAMKVKITVSITLIGFLSNLLNSFCGWWQV